MNFANVRLRTILSIFKLITFRNLKQPYWLFTHHSVDVKSFSIFGALNMSSEVFSDNNWRGVPLTEMYGSQSPWGAPEFPLATPGFNHAVLYHVPNSGLAGDRPPKPQIGHDKWDQDHVRMPCSSHSLYPVEGRNGQSRLKKRWEIIENALSWPIRNSKELADAILSYNTKFKGVWKFHALTKLFDECLEEEESQYFFDVTLPEMAKLALALPKLIQSPIPLLKQHKNNSISLSQQQIASLLANAFFCTFPRRNTTKRTSEYATYPLINFNRLYESSGSDHVIEKLKCICHYFRRVCTKVGRGAVTFTRRSVVPRALPSWPECDASLAALPLHIDPDGTIEDADGLIQVDFANKFLGGGVLSHGCVQEEIRFVICPELLVSMLFTELLKPNEALLIIGAERYSRYCGYGHSFQWAGDFADRSPRDSSLRRRCAVLAIDALPYSGAAEEYRRACITRELNKAWVGFSIGAEAAGSLRYPGVATGNWGCGAFGGSPRLKSLLQLMAAAAARRPLSYYTFKDNGIRDDLLAVYNLLARYNVTVGQLYNYLMKFCQSSVRPSQLYTYLHQALRDEDSAPSTSTDVFKCSGETAEATQLMETSATSETSLQDLKLTSDLQKELSKDSPDLFTDSQESGDESIFEIKIQKDEVTSKQAEKSETKNQPLTLFEAMQKDDEQSTGLNLFSPSTSPFKQRSVRVSNSKTSIDKNDTTQSDPTTELKKRVSRKITDYFSKKPI